MKKSFFIIFSLLSIGICIAQVGINTKTPQAALDIQSKGNTVSTQALLVKSNSSVNVFDLRDNGIVLTSGVSSSPVLLDLRDGKNNSILAIGESNQTAAVAKKGAVKYDTNTKSLYLSDNTSWKALASDYIKAFVVADITSATQSFANNTSNTIKNWVKVSDLTNSFNPTTGVFTAQRASVYSVSLNITLNDGTINAKTQLQASLVASGGQQVKSITTFNAASGLSAGVQCSGNFQLALGETLSVVLWHNMGVAKQIKVGYNNLTIVEL